MKRYLAFVISFVLLVYVSLTAYSHPGSLDENGGHYNRKTGEYHYHDGDHTESTGNNEKPTTSPTPFEPSSSASTVLTSRSDFSYFLESLIEFIFIPLYIVSWIVMSGYLYGIVENIFPLQNNMVFDGILLMSVFCISAIITGYVGNIILNFIKTILFY